MFKKPFFNKLFTAAFIALLGISSSVQARPLPANVVVQQGDTKKLPPVNWVRSRKIDIKHLDIDLRFDWDKSQAIGTEVVTFAPFSDTDRFTLDAAMMSIDSVTLNGAPLKFNYDGKAGDDNLEIMLDSIHRAGEDIAVKIAYKTNYVNGAEPD